MMAMEGCMLVDTLPSFTKSQMGVCQDGQSLEYSLAHSITSLLHQSALVVYVCQI